MFFTYSEEEVEVVEEEKEIISLSLVKYTDSGFLLERVTDG